MSSTCTLIGCFCAPTTFVPVLCALLDEQNASQDVLLARLTTLAALLQGSGKAHPYFMAAMLLSCQTTCEDFCSRHGKS